MIPGLLLQRSKKLQKLAEEIDEVRAAERKWQARYAQAEAEHRQRHADWLSAQEAALLGSTEAPPEPRWEPPAGANVFAEKLHGLRQRERQLLIDEADSLLAQLEEREAAVLGACRQAVEELTTAAVELEALANAARAVHGALAPGGPGVQGVYADTIDAAKVVECVQRASSFLRPPAGILR